MHSLWPLSLLETAQKAHVQEMVAIQGSLSTRFAPLEVKIKCQARVLGPS